MTDLYAGTGITEILENRLVSVANEMREIVMRSSHSPLWREAGDLSCAILSPNGDSIAQGAADLPVHLATMPASVKGALTAIPASRLKPGDAVLHNLPTAGNNHLPDTLLFSPIFIGQTLIALAAVRAHWLDIGGYAPGGSDPTSRDAYQEGLRIPPVRVFRRGRLQKEIIGLILENVRQPDERMSDFLAQYAGCQHGANRVIATAEEFGVPDFRAAQSAILDRAENRMRAQIAALADGQYESTDFLDAVSGDPARIHATVRVAGDSISVDFDGTADETESAVNCPIAVTSSAVYYVMKSVLDPLTPCNSGSYRPIAISAPVRSILNPSPDRAVTASNTITSYAVVNAVMGAMARVAPDRACAGDSATTGGATFAGFDARPGFQRGWVFREVHAGAGGAMDGHDGASAIRVGVGNTGNTPVEVIEEEYPLLVERSEVAWEVRASGKWRGGAPLRRVYRILSAGTVFTLSGARSSVPAYGLAGGQQGALGRFEINPGSRRTQVLPGRVGLLSLKSGTRIMIQCGGGGAWGRPVVPTDAPDQHQPRDPPPAPAE